MSGDQIVYEQKKEFGERLVNGEWKRMESTNREQTQAQCYQRVIAECQMNYLLGRHCAFLLILYIYHVYYNLYIHVQVKVTPDGSNLDLSKFLITQSDQSPVPILFTTQLSNNT